MAPRTLYEKIWNAHVVAEQDDGYVVLYIDRHLIIELSSPQAFEGLRQSGRRVRRPETCVAVADHNVPTDGQRRHGITDPEALLQVQTLERNAAEHGIDYIPILDPRHGIIHMIGPELGITQPGITLCCGDSHTSTHGAFGALAFGIGISEVEHVLATQTMVMRPFRPMQVEVTGILPPGVTGKDLTLAVIGRIGTAGGTGHVIEYTGSAVRALSMEGRMTLCNMAIEAGARAGLVAPDDKTYAYLEGRPKAPKGRAWEQALAHWQTLPTDAGARYETQVTIDGAAVAPQVTWGTNPEQVLPVTGRVPDPASEPDPRRRAAIQRALDYMALTPGMRLEDVPVDRVFIGSCTNARIEDLREAAHVLAGRRIAARIGAMVVPGSYAVRAQAEAEGLDRIFVEAGFEWREPGCSMCLAMNGDSLAPGERCASTSNRNFEGRQGRDGRTHLMSPAMAAAAAVTGHLTDVRALLR